MRRHAALVLVLPLTLARAALDRLGKRPPSRC